MSFYRLLLTTFSNELKFLIIVMHHPRHDTSRTQFQLERLTFFSDSIFAISITLLVIEIKVPGAAELRLFTDASLWNYLSHASFKFFGFLISFGIIGHYWSVHHRIFGYASNYTSALLWINFAFLFSVVLLPFSSGLLGEYGTRTNMYLPYAVYVGNMCLTGITNCWLWLYISNPKRKLLTHKISGSRIQLGLRRSLVVPIVFAFALMVSFFLPIVSRFIPVLIPIILNWGMKGLEKKADREEAAGSEIVHLPPKTEEKEA
jgi:uncharacterized membrane protein